MQLLLRRICRMLLEVRTASCAVGLFGWNFESECVGEVEANQSFGLDLDLLTAGDGVGSGTDTAAGSGSNGCALASAENTSEDCSDSCAAADFFSGVGAATLALDAVRVSVDGDFFAAAIDAGEFDGEKGATFVVGGLLYGDDATGDGSALTDDDKAVGDDVGGDGAGEVFALLRGGAVEGFRDSDGNGGAGGGGDVVESRRGWRRWWGRREFLRRGRRGRRDFGGSRLRRRCGLADYGRCLRLRLGGRSRLWLRLDGLGCGR